MTTSKSRHPQGSDGPHTISTVSEFDLRVLDDDAPMLHWALAYANLGLMVLPLRPGTGRPLHQRSQRHATRDQERIRSWWSQFPNANIGIVTGKGIDAAHFDAFLRADGTVEYSYEPVVEELEVRGVLDGLVGLVLTGHGGMQFVFPAECGQRSHRVSQLHLELLSLDAFMVAPPSHVLPGPGREGPCTYRWISGLDFARDGAAPADFNAWLGFLDESVDLVARTRSQRAQLDALGARLGRLAARGGPFTARWALGAALEIGADVGPIVRALQAASRTEAEVCPPPLGVRRLEAKRNV